MSLLYVFIVSTQSNSNMFKESLQNVRGWINEAEKFGGQDTKNTRW